MESRIPPRWFRRRVAASAAAVLLIVPIVPATADVVGFVESPTTNSADWRTRVTDLGGEIETLDFEAHPVGPLQTDFYAASHGVMLIGEGLGDVEFGDGPGEHNDFALGGTRKGEGQHTGSNYIFDPQGFSTLTVSFETPVIGAGLFIIDYFNPGNGINLLKVEAFDGPNGTGERLCSTSNGSGGCSFRSPRKVNFQKNKLYFMGILSAEPNIRSFVFTDIDGNLGDRTGIDDILIARPKTDNTPS